MSIPMDEVGQAPASQIDDPVQWLRHGEGFVDAGMGLWRSISPSDHPDPASAELRPALFLDRDGVIVVEKNYLARAEDVELIPGTLEALQQAKAAGYALIVVTNQSGIARGYFNWSDFEAVHAEIDRQLATVGIKFDAVFACGYHKSGSGMLSVPDHDWRKPGPGMIRAAISALDINPSVSYLVGDKAADLGAAKAAMLRGGILVRTGYGSMPAEIDKAKILATTSYHVGFSADLANAWAELQRLSPQRRL